MSRSIGTLLVLAFLAPLSRATTWTVASTGGDFTTIQAAIDAAAPGDVIRVTSGNYPSFTLGKDVAILGVPTATNPRPKVSGLSTIATANPRVAGLELRQLVVQNVSGVALLDDLVVSGLSGLIEACDHAMRVENCNAVHLARSEVRGKDGDAWCEGPGLVVEHAYVTITASSITGGTGWGDDFFAYSGQPALIAGAGARVLLAGTDCFGGAGGTPQIPFGGTGGDGAVAIEMDDSGAIEPRVNIRGDAKDTIQGGQAGGGIGASPAFQVVGGNGGTLTFSGASHSPATLASVLIDVVLPAPEEPFTTLVGSDLPNSYKRLSLHGPFGAPTIVLVSLGAAHLPAPSGAVGSIFVDPGSIVASFPVVLTGQDLSVNVTFQLPPSLLGIENTLITVQTFTGGVLPSGAWFAQNPAFLLLRG